MVEISNVRNDIKTNPFLILSRLFCKFSSVLKVSTADQFYSAMAHLSVQLLDEKIIDGDNLIKVKLDRIEK